MTSANDGKKSVTFTKDVAPIFFKNRAGCHRPNDTAPMSLLSYKEARPSWSADPRYGEFSNDTSLSQRDIDTIAAWVDQGAKEGDARDLPPAPAVSDPREISNPDIVLSMQQEWTGEAEGLDDNVEFTVPTGFTEDRWIQGVEFLPGKSNKSRWQNSGLLS